MAMIEVTLCLDLDAQDDLTEARAFIDLQPDGGLSSEVEVPLWADGQHQWRGVFALDEGRDESFSYRIGVFAQADAEWSLRFRRCGSDKELLSDCDRLAAPKTWLLGHCNSTPALPVAASRASALAQGDRRGRPGPALRLIRGGA